MTDKDSPLARGIRTFMFLLASSGAMAALLQTDWLHSWRTGGVTIGIAFLSALLGGIAAFVLAQSQAWRARTQSPLFRSLATAGEQFAAALASIAIVNIDSNVLASTGQLIVNFAVAAVLAFGLSYAQNVVEDAGTAVQQGS